MKKWLLMGLVGLCGSSAFAEDIVVGLTSSNGVLTATGMMPGSTCTVEWVSNLQETFTNQSEHIHFSDLVADEEGAVSLPIPMFFRVIGVPQPEGMVAIPAGTNSGTNPLGDGESYGPEYPETYSLTVDAFWMGETKVTNDEMIRVMQWAYDQGRLDVSSAGVTNATGNQQELLELDDVDCRITWDGSTFGLKSTKGAGYPCGEVTWYGSVAYCNYRSEMEDRALCYDLNDWGSDLTAKGYRLPTSEEWEYAARGGLSGKRFPWGDTINHSNANYIANGSAYSYDTSPYTSYTYHPDYDDGDRLYTSPSGAFPANGYGLRDTSGNLFEWCNDVRGSDHVIRGGCWIAEASYARCGNVHSIIPDHSASDLGFRAVCY